jgi:hypothetical protein
VQIPLLEVTEPRYRSRISNALRGYTVGYNTQKQRSVYLRRIIWENVNGKYLLMGFIADDFIDENNRRSLLRSAEHYATQPFGKPYAKRGSNVELICKTIAAVGENGASGWECRDAIAKRNGRSAAFSYASSYFSNNSSNKKMVGKYWFKGENKNWYLTPLGMKIAGVI